MTSGARLETREAGEGKIEIEGADGASLESITLRVQAAARVDIEVSDGVAIAPGPDGVYAVNAGHPLSVASNVFGSDGGELFFTKHGVTHEYSDANVIAPSGDDDLSTRTQNLNAQRVGEATVTVRAAGASRAVRFRVSP